MRQNGLRTSSQQPPTWRPADGAAGCNEFSRSQLLRNAAAEAGRGLPPIERGMPAPAGTGLSRRSFMLRSGPDALGLRRLPAGARPAAGRNGEGRGRPRPNDRQRVLEGGIDSLSVLAPVADPGTGAFARPWRWASAGPVFAEDTASLASGGRRPRHPAPRGQAGPVSRGGLRHPNQSHFTSRHYWEVGSLDPGGRTGGWGGYLDLIGIADNPLQGLSLDGHLSPALAPATVPVAASTGLATTQGAGLWAESRSRIRRRRGDREGTPSGATRPSGPAASPARRCSAPPVGAPAASPPQAGHVPERTSPQPRDAGSDAERRAPVRCVALNGHPRYDTHRTRSELNADLQETAEALLAFQRDLEARNCRPGDDPGLVGVRASSGGERLRRDRPRRRGAGRHRNPGQGRMIGAIPADPARPGRERASDRLSRALCSLLEQWFGEDAAQSPRRGPLSAAPDHR